MDELSGKFISAELRPVIMLSPQGDEKLATVLHTLAHQKCYIANSLTFDVNITPTIRQGQSI